MANNSVQADQHCKYTDVRLIVMNAIGKTSLDANLICWYRLATTNRRDNGGRCCRISVILFWELYRRGGMGVVNCHVV